MISMRNALLLGAAVLLVACSPSRGNGSDDDDDDDGGAWTLEIVNETSNTFEMIQHRPCPSEDDEDWNEVPLPAGGIAPGESHRAQLPTPSCYALTGEGEGCFFDGTTGSLQLGDQVTWTVTDEDLTCAGM